MSNQGRDVHFPPFVFPLCIDKVPTAFFLHGQCIANLYKVAVDAQSLWHWILQVHSVGSCTVEKGLRKRKLPLLCISTRKFVQMYQKGREMSWHIRFTKFQASLRWPADTLLGRHDAIIIQKSPGLLVYGYSGGSPLKTNALEASGAVWSCPEIQNKLAHSVQGSWHQLLSRQVA